jgi:hypothetical protein
MSAFYMGTVNDYVTHNAKGIERHRIRLEIKKAFHSDFLDRHFNGQELAIFVIDMDDYKDANRVEEIMEEFDEFEGNAPKLDQT